MKPETVLKIRKLALRASAHGRFTLPLSILRRLFCRASGTVRINNFDGDLEVELRLSEHMQSRIFWMGYYNREVIALLDQLLQPGMTFIDIGANIGEVSMVAAKRVGASGTVVAFEPVEHHADRLEAHLVTNRLDWSTVARVALADRSGRQVMFDPCAKGTISEENFGLGTLYDSASASPIGTVEVVTLDEYLLTHPLHRVDVVKIDIEGAELPCLIGARHTIASHLPHVIIEVQAQSAKAAGYEQSAILEELAQHGYTFRKLTTGGRTRPIAAGGLGDYQNVLCIPPSRLASRT
jgi:FkbM family methyltransferase